MKQDFSCDYLVDITGLVDDGKNLYSCCHPSGVMCGKEDCPVVIDFNRRCQKEATTIDYASDYENPSATIFHGMNGYGKEASDYQTTMAENPSGTIDYDGLTRGKLCPIYVAALTVSGHTSEDKYLAECGPAAPGMTQAKNAVPCYQ